jgi:hypothetical protein
MTERMSFYLTLMDRSDVITKSIIVFTAGLMALGFIMSRSPFKIVRELSNVPFWTFIVILFLVILVGLLILQWSPITVLQ